MLEMNAEGMHHYRSPAHVTGADTPPQARVEGEELQVRVDIELLLKEAHDTPTAAKMEDLIGRVKKTELPFEEIEQFLGALANASFISIPQKEESLFILAVERDNAEAAADVLTGSSFDKASLCLKLIQADPEKYRIGISLLLKERFKLSAAQVTIPNVMLLIENGADVNEKQFLGMPFLVYALSKNNERLISAILENKPDLASLFQIEYVPVVQEYVARKNGKMPGSTQEVLVTFEFLGASFQPIANQPSLLHVGVELQDISIIYYALNKGISPNHGDSEGLTPLHWLCRMAAANQEEKTKQQQMGELLIAGNASINAQSNKKQTPLHYCFLGPAPRLDLMEFLLDKGADPFIKDLEKKCPLAIGLLTRSQPIITSFMIRVNQLPPGKYLDAIKDIMWNPTQLTALREFLSTIVANYNADILCSDEGIELFLFICNLGMYDFCDQLIERGFQLDRIDANERSILSRIFKASSFGTNKNILRYCERLMYMDKFPIGLNDIAIRNREGDTLLHWAAQKLKPVEKDEAQDEAARRNKWTQFIQLLFAFGAPVNARNHAGFTPLFYALERKQAWLVEMLERAKANPYFLGDQWWAYAERKNAGSGCYQDNPLFQVMQASQQPTMQGKYQEAAAALQASMGQEAALEAVIEYNFFRSPSRIAALMQNKPMEVFLDHLMRLHAKYPEAPIDYFYLIFLKVNEKHLARQLIDSSIPKAPENIDLKELIKLFQRINFNEKNAPAYRDPQRIKIYGSFFKRDDLYSRLRKLIEVDFPAQTPNAGTPRAGSEDLKEFYASLDNIFKLIIVELQALQNLELKTKCILKLAHAAGFCGTRWETMAGKIYRKLKLNKRGALLYEELADEELGKLRSEGIKVLSTTHFDGNVVVNIHLSKQIHGLIGKVYNIPSNVGMTDIREMREVPLTPELAKFRFSHLYNPRIIFSQMTQFINDSIRKNDGVPMKWFRAHIPENWGTDSYKAHAYALTMLELFLADQPQLQEASKSLLMRRGLSWAGRVGNPSAREVLEATRAEEFIEDIYDFSTGEVRVQGVFHFLKTQDILVESHLGIFMEFQKRWNQKEKRKDEAPEVVEVTGRPAKRHGPNPNEN